MQAHRIEFDIKKTYASRENCIKAVEKVFGANQPHFGSADVQWLIAVNAEGRFFPVFIGERAIQKMVHFTFPVAN